MSERWRSRVEKEARAVGDVIRMPPPKKPDPAGDDIDQMGNIAHAKQQIAKIIWYMPVEEALGILADIAFRVIRKTFVGEHANGAAKIFCDEVIRAVEQANSHSQ